MNRLALFLALVSSLLTPADAQIFPSIQPAGDFTFDLGSGTSASLSLGLMNQDGSQATNWELMLENEGDRTTAGTLQRINDAAGSLLELIPRRHLFSGGESGIGINDFGGEMYNSGNRITLNSTTLNYSNNAVASVTAGTGSASYFTRKFDGLFLLSADLTGISSFAISGTLGAARNGPVTGGEFTLESGGQRYRAFVKQVHGGNIPTVNHLILVPDLPGITRSYLEQPTSDDHILLGLPASLRLHFLVFSQPAGGYLDLSVHRALAGRYLAAADSAPDWFQPSARKGRLEPAQTAALPCQVSAGKLPAGSYSARFTIAPAGTLHANVPPSAWRQVGLEVSAPAFTVDPETVVLSSLAGFDPAPAELKILPSGSGPLPGDLSASSSEAWLVPSIANGTVTLQASTATLAAGTYLATVSIGNADTRREVTVFLQIGSLNITQFLPDPTRAKIYGIVPNGADRGGVVVIDTVTRRTIGFIPVGREPSDLDLTESAAELLVCNTADDSVSRIDLETMQVIATHVLPEFSHEIDTFGGHVADGPGSILYYIDEARGPRLRVYDTATARVLQTLGALSGDSPDLSDNTGFGDIVVRPDRSALFGWSDYQSPFGGSGGTHIVRFAIQPDGTLSGYQRSTSSNSTATPNFQESPIDTPAMITPDGSRLIIKDREIDQDDLDFHPVVFPNELYAISPGAEIACGPTRLYRGTAPAGFYDLPSFGSTVQAITPDYTWHVAFNPTTRTLDWLDLRLKPGHAALGLGVFPEDGGTVAQPSELRWAPVADVRAYQIYLGESQAAVEGATLTSPEYLGTANGTSFRLPFPLTKGRNYFWRLVAVQPDGSAAPGPLRSFFVSPLTLSRTSIEGTTVVGNTRHPELLRIESSAPAGWVATADVPWLSFTEDSGTTPSVLTAVTDASQLARGLHAAAITLTSGGTSFQVPVTIDVRPVNYSLAKPDPVLPRIYAISEESSSSQPGFLLSIDSVTGTIQSAVPVGRGVTDFTVHVPENRIYIANWAAGVLRALDRSTFQEVQTYAFAPVTDSNTSRDDVRRIAAGRAGRLMVEENRAPAKMKLMDTATGAILASQTGLSGGGVFDPGGRYYFHGDQNNSNAAFHKFDTQGDLLREVASVRVTGQSTSGSARVGISGDGSRVYWNGGILDPDLRVLRTFTEEIIASTAPGDLVFTLRSMFNANNGLKLGTPPEFTYHRVVSQDQAKLFAFVGEAVTWVDLATVAKLPAWNLTPAIAHGTTLVGTRPTLSWSVEPFALSYEVYFGTDAAALATATPGGPGHLGRVTGTTWTGDLPPLALNGEYFWRIDTNGVDGSKTGSVWSFNIAPIDVTPREVIVAVASGATVPQQRLTFSSPVTAAWTAATTTPWIALDATSGNTTSPLTFRINPAGLANATHSGSITLQSGGDTFAIPVHLDIVQLNLTLLAPDPNRPVVYGISYRIPAQGVCHLLKIDGPTGAILEMIRIGRSVTDLAVDPVTDRLYLTNWGYPETRVVDLATFRERAPLMLGTNVNRIELDPPRQQIITEGEQQSIDISVFDLASGAKVNFVTAAAGDGRHDPARGVYYHAEVGTDREIFKYDFSTTPGTLLAKSEKGFGTRQLLLTSDGSKIVRQGVVYDPNLNRIGTLPGSVWSLSPGGELAVGESQIWWLDSGTPVVALPFATQISSFTADSRHLILFDPSARVIRSVPLSQITELPGPWPHDRQVFSESPAFLSWMPVEGAVSYRVVLSDGHNAERVFDGIPEARLTLPGPPLEFGEFYSWRVTAIPATGPPVEGSTYSFTIAFPQGPPVTGLPGQAVALGPDHLLLGTDGSATLSRFDPLTGTNAPLETLTVPDNSSDHGFGSPVTLDGSIAHIGARNWDTPQQSNAGAIYHFDAAAIDRARPRQITAPVLTANQLFGGGLASGGDLLLAGPSSGSTALRGKVFAYLSHPATVLTQELQPSDSVVADRFGYSIVLDGNTAVIASPGRGPSPSTRLPCAYVFTRSTTTGLWSQTQKLTLPNAISGSDAGSSMALGGDLLAINNVSQDEVMVFTREPGGTFAHHSTIARTAVPGSTNQFAGSVALHNGLLLIGDTAALPSSTTHTGVVFTFRRSGATWVAGPTIQPKELRAGFGRSLAVRDGWLLAGAAPSFTAPIPAWLFRIDPTPNATPTLSALPHQAVRDRAFEAIVVAADRDGLEGLTLSALQLPGWLAFTDLGDGRGRLAGTPTAAAGTTFEFQLKATDATGASCYRTTRLTILDPADLPAVTLAPATMNLKEGQELTLRAMATGSGPITWQWQLDGADVPGATAASLHLPEAGPDDAGSYTVTARNAAGAATSQAATVTIVPADRFAGPWTTFGNGPRRSGHHPARLGRHRFTPAWEKQLHPSNPLTRAVIAGGDVFLSEALPIGIGAQAASLHGLQLADGGTVWKRNFTDTSGSNPLTWNDKRLYYQQSKNTTDNLVWSLAAEDGSTLWSANYTAQDGNYEAPAVTGDGVWMTAGYGSGIYGFALDGTPRFKVELPQYNDWTPAVSDGRLFSWVNGVLREHDPALGTLLWSINSGMTWPGPTLPAIQGNSVAALGREALCCFDLPSRSIRWQLTRVFSGSPAIAGDLTYVIRGSEVESYHLADGNPGPVFAAGDTIISGQPLVLHDHLIVSTANSVLVFHRDSGALVQTIPGGGLLSYADGHLVVAGTNGLVRAFFANAAPAFTMDVPASIRADDAASDLALDLSPFAGDADASDDLIWAIVSVSRPEIFRSLTIDSASGDVGVSYNPWQSGSSVVVISITDPAGNVTQTTLTFTVPAHPAPALGLAEKLVLNRQTGLYEHIITVTNSGAREIAGFDLAVTGLPAGVVLNNASGTDGTTWTVQHRKPLAAGASVTLVLEYYTPVRGTVIKPQVAVRLVTEPESDPAAGDPGLAVDRCEVLADGLLIEFTTVSGRLYEIQYSDDTRDWKVSPIRIRAAGNRTQWIDRGPPRTDSHPQDKASRFYRVREIPATAGP